MRFAVAVLIFVVFAVSCVVSAYASGSQSVSLSIDVGEMIDMNRSTIVLSADESYELTVPANISFSIEAYRGKTLKRTVYVWIEDKGRNKISSTTKFSLPVRFEHYNLSGEVKISSSYEDDDYIFVAEGIDADWSEPIALYFDNSVATVQDAESGSISYSILTSPDSVSAGQSFSTRVTAHNPTDEDLEFEAWSYVYRGSRCISDNGEREHNRKTINFPEHSDITFDLDNTINQDAEPGNYTIKVKILRSDRKTPVELKRTITVTDNSTATEMDDAVTQAMTPAPGSAASDRSDYSPSKKEITISPLTITGDAVLNPLNDTDNTNRSGLLFLSSSAKAKDLVTFILMIVLAGIAIALVLKKL